MDLRPYALSEDQIAQVASLLNYQPFRVSDTIVTGVGYSWLHETNLDRVNQPQLLFDATRESPEVWDNAVAASERLARSYESFLDVIQRTCPRGSYLDLCCNNGYMPVGASIRGMSPAIGTDAGNFSAQIALLNDLTGSRARFVQAEYHPIERRFVPPIEGQFDIVSNMAFIIHVAEPLHFLRSITDLARHGVFLWSAFPPSEEMIIRYPKPNQFSSLPFPWGFDAGTAVSEPLLIYSMRELGFPKYFEIAPEPSGWPLVWNSALMSPYQPLRAFMFTRS